MKLKIIFTLYCLIIGAVPTISQSKIRGEIYLLIDTASTPNNDRIYQIVENKPLIEYHIYCPIYTNPNWHPYFLRSIRHEPQLLSKDNFYAIKLTSLKDFLKILRKEQNYINLWKVHIIEKRKKKYYMSNVVFGGTGDPEIE